MKHFTLKEFTRSQTAERLHIDNTPDTIAIHNMQQLVRHILDPARNFLRQPIHINSGYRSRQLNKAIGGVPASQHCTGHAADIRTLDMTKLYRYLTECAEFDQLIYYKSQNFIHISYVTHRKNRHQIIIKP